MGSNDILQAVGDEILQAARGAALRSQARIVIGWWNDGAQRRFMLLPEGHRVTGERPFLPLLVINPSGRTEMLAA